MINSSHLKNTNFEEKNKTKLDTRIENKNSSNYRIIPLKNHQDLNKIKNNTNEILNKKIGRNLHENKKQKEEIKEKINSPFTQTQSLDQIYMKLKMQELNEDFERRQKLLELDKKINNIEAENAELNVYRKIITISISLIVTGLLMGVLLGLILVMYLNSKK